MASYCKRLVIYALFSLALICLPIIPTFHWYWLSLLHFDECCHWCTIECSRFTSPLASDLCTSIFPLYAWR